MGINQSRTDTGEKIFRNELPISISLDVVNQLSDQLHSPETTPERQSALDAHIRSRIQSELDSLRRGDENVSQQIKNALEKEDLDRERSVTGEASAGDGNALEDVRSGTTLIGDLEEIRNKVDRYRSRRDLSQLPEIRTNSEAIISCYKVNSVTPLNCWREVRKFKASVARVEQQYIRTLH